ncbi:hypothetical protein OG471_28690 [Streptomyces sp. NBC_01336]|uniref:hypothetical protein n=1 Tax=Streptomyces sp. NBC_01336 TaxID=2903829 RepID=UPI002E0DD6AA|nr:hypothetical protein OG471_28690 [Streptomyces sp. NBC_01336]
MMPGTLVKPLVRVPVQSTLLDRVRDLTGSERVVALYASDMPSGRRRHSSEQVREWIVQGVERLGAEETRRWAQFFYGHRLLDLHGLVTPQIQQRHEQRFPKRGRLNVADQQAAGSVCGDSMTAETLLRNGIPAVNGDCPCRGTRYIPAFYDEDCGPVDMLCPIHARAEIRRHHAGYRQSADQRDEARHTSGHAEERRS